MVISGCSILQMAKFDIITIWKITIAVIFRKYLCHNRKKGFCFFFLFLSFPIFFILFMEIQYFALACFVSQIARTLCELSEYIIILCILSKQKHKLEYFHNSSSKIANIFICMISFWNHILRLRSLNYFM